MNGLNALIAQGGGRMVAPLDIQAAQRNALINRGAELELGAYPEERNWLRTQRGMATESFGMEKEKFGMAKEQYLREKEKQPMKDEAEALEYLMNIAPMISYDKYASSRKWLIERNKINPDLLPDPQAFEAQAAQSGIAPQDLFEQWKSQSMMTGKQRFELLKQQAGKKEETVPTENRQFEIESGMKEEMRGSKAYAAGISAWRKEKKAKDEPRTDLEKTIDKYNSLPEGAEKQFYLARINKLTQTTGMKVTVDKDGNVTLVQGPMGKEGFEGLSKKTQGMIEEKLLSGKEQLNRMEIIYDEWKPEYSGIWTRLKNSMTGIKAKLEHNVSEKDATELTKFKKFQRKAIENINLYIKEMTGANMSEKEADRLRLAQPDAGETWYQGDDPITFKAKMDDVLKTTRAAIARYEYYKTKGLSDSEIIGLVKSNKAISLDTIAERM